MQLSSAIPTSRFGGLDGLRAIAVTLVLVYHFFPRALPGGFLGVDIFFVISGFLITSLLLREHRKYRRISLAAFWQRRARRLLPALGLMLLVCTSLAAAVGGDLLVGIGRQLAGAAAFVSNWVFVAAGADYFTRDTPELFRNTWSLAIEEQFYIVLPLIVLLLIKICRKPTAALLLIVAGVASALWMAHLSLADANATRVYFGSDTHAFGLIFGAAMAVAARNHAPVALPTKRAQLGYVALAIAGLATLGVLAVTLQEGSQLSFQGGFQLATAATLITVWAITRPGAWIGSALDNTPMSWVGARSYGLYLWHWPLLLIAGSAFPAAASWQVALIALAGTFCCAALSYRFVEQPVRALGLRRSLRALVQPVKYTPRRRTVAIALGAVLAVSIPATAYAVASAPTQSSAQSAIERGAAHVQTATEPATAPATESKPNTAEKQTSSKQTAKKTAPAPGAPVIAGTDITAIGDSVMLASAPELNAAFPGLTIDAAVSRGMGVGVEIVADAAGQGTLRHVLVVGLGTNGTVSVAELEAISDAAEGHPLVLVNAYGDREWIPGVNETLQAFAAEHRSIVVANWNDMVTGVPDALAGDDIHPNPSGGEIYAKSIQTALAALDTPQEALGFNLPRR